MSTLHTERLSVTYGGLRAVDSVSITLEGGSAVGLIGPNGAGKTSFLDGLTGLTPATGSIKFDDRDIGSLPAYKRASLGLRRTWQSGELFDDLTVGENLAVSVEPPTLRSVLSEFVAPRREELRDRAAEALSVFGLERVVDDTPQSLPLGVQKLVGVARALVSKPRVLGLDEPAAGLDRFESREFGRHLRPIVDSGIALMLIDHDMDLVLSVCDYVYVLDFGRLIAEGTPAQIQTDQRVLTAYLGRESRSDVAPDDIPAATDGMRTGEL
jgi:branched-chain amino acid transport system ATP-binding protein